MQVFSEDDMFLVSELGTLSRFEYAPLQGVDLRRGNELQMWGTDWTCGLRQGRRSTLVPHNPSRCTPPTPYV